jgi:hypothetical protein
MKTNLLLSQVTQLRSNHLTSIFSRLHISKLPADRLIANYFRENKNIGLLHLIS